MTGKLKPIEWSTNYNIGPLYTEYQKKLTDQMRDYSDNLILNELSNPGTSFGMDTSNSTSWGKETVFRWITPEKHDDTIASLLAISKMKSEHPDKSSEELIKHTDYLEYKRRAERLINHLLKCKDEQEEESILVLQSFFDIPDMIKELL